MIVDENGYEWLVLNGDPAYPLIRVLNSRGYTTIVLPAKVLTFGAEYGILRARLESPPVPPAGALEPPPDVVIRAVRLSECLDRLEKDGALA